MCFGPSLISLLPPLPPGDWNTGHISKDTATERPHFIGHEKIQLAGITNIWHPLLIDHLELHMERKLRSNVYEASHPRFDSLVIVKFARFAWEIPQVNAETAAYQWIESHQIGLRFLGHLTEEGRIIGFITERITDCRHATFEDHIPCELTLSKLHGLGIKHGDINKHNFLIQDTQATLIDFDLSSRCKAVDALDEEFRRPRKELQDTSGRGGRTVESRGRKCSLVVCDASLRRVSRQR